MNDLKKGRWNEDEIAKLVKAVSCEPDWKKVAKMVGTRDRTQCVVKWKCLHKLHEGGRFKFKFKFYDREWSPDEHRMMIDLYKQFPKNWEMIANVDSNLNFYA